MPGSNGRNQRLDTWKEIAGYLRRDERTAIRWEKHKGLPVHRVPGGMRRAVFAYPEELDAWLTRARSPNAVARSAVLQEEGDSSNESLIGRAAVETVATLTPADLSEAFADKKGGPRPERVRLNQKHLLTASLTAVVLLGLLGWRLQSRARVEGARIPVRVEFTASSLQAFDEMGRIIWSHSFADRVDASFFQGHLADRVRIADFRGDGEREVLAFVPTLKDVNSPSPDHWEVDLFSSKGRVLWSYVPHGKFQFGKHELDSFWLPISDFVSSHGGKKQIWVSVSHQVWGNSFVVNLDPVTGKDTLRFVNTGSVHAINEITTPEATYLIVGGFNNESDTGSLALMDERREFAASPQTEDTRHKCVNCPAGDPDYYFVFPRSELNELAQVHEAAVMGIEPQGDEVQIRKRDLDPWGSTQLIYLLKADRGVHVVSLRYDSGYDMAHRKLEQEGKLRHSVENCPERLHPRPIRMWTPAEGWTEVRLEPGRGSE
jgi:hypothetical protein